MLWRIPCGSVSAFWSLLTFFSIISTTSRAQEYRALWVDAFHAGFRTASEVDALISNARTGNFNAVVVEIRKRGDAYYNSNYEPKANDISPPSFDPLAYLVSRAHDTNAGARIEVHAWIVSFNIWNSLTAPTNAMHPFNLHPDWLTQDNSGASWDGGNYAFDPGHPGVQQHTFNVAMDIISNYDVDGLNFDYIRYAGNVWGYNPVAVDRFNRKFGSTGEPAPTNPQWLQFRRDQVSALVRKVYLSTAALKPHVKISADTITWSPAPTSETSWTNSSAAYTSVLQDWRSWMQEGILDLNIPMTYFDQATYPVQWQNWNVFAKDHRYNRHLAVGPGIYLNTVSNGLYQMRHALSASPLGNPSDGLCVYSYAVPTDEPGISRATFLSALTKTNTAWQYDPNPSPLFVNPATVPVMPWKAAPTRGHLKGIVAGGVAGNTLDGAALTLTGPTNRTLFTDATGFYGAVDLAPGAYTISAQAPGFGTQSSNFTVNAGVVSTINFLLGTNDTDPPLLTGIRATNISSTSASILWTTDELADSILDFGPTLAYGTSLTNTTYLLAHSNSLAGLNSATTYHFRVRSKDSAGNSATSPNFTFTTLAVGAVPDLIIDDVDASIAGAWSIGTTAIDKFGTGYRFKSAGTGGAWLEYAPNITTAGRYAVYEWHSQGGNRTTNAQHVITHNGGKQTIIVNQEINGGRWNLLGAFEFNAGASGAVRITDLSPDAGNVVIADAIKFVFVPAPPSITLQPQSRIVKAGSNVIFTVQAAGTAPMSYQWRFNNADILRATNNSVTISNAQPVNGGTYFAIVSNMAGTNSSNPATLTVNLPPAPAFVSVTALPNQRVRLLLNVDPGTPCEILTSQILSNWTVLARFTNATPSFAYDDSTTNGGQRFYRARSAP